MYDSESAKLGKACAKVLETRTYWLLAPSVGLVKIGKSHDPVARLLTLRTMNAAPVEPLLIHRIPEAELHDRFKSLRKHGEWFTIDSKMVSYLQSINEPDAADRLEQAIVLGG